MSEIRDKVECEAERILSRCMEETDPHGNVGISIPKEIMIDPVRETAMYLVKQILSIPELATGLLLLESVKMGNEVLDKLKIHRYDIAVVDREAILPSPGTELELKHRLVTLEGIIGAYRIAQQDMTEAGWVKEVKNET